MAASVLSAAVEAVHHESDGVPAIDRALLAAWLQAARKGAEKTQRQAAAVLDVPAQTISNWETGRHPIGAIELLHLATFYAAEDSFVALLRGKWIADENAPASEDPPANARLKRPAKSPHDKKKRAGGG